jgi:hypothetical protein
LNTTPQIFTALRGSDHLPHARLARTFDDLERELVQGTCVSKRFGRRVAEREALREDEAPARREARRRRRDQRLHDARVVDQVAADDEREPLAVVDGAPRAAVERTPLEAVRRHAAPRQVERAPVSVRERDARAAQRRARETHDAAAAAQL